VVKKYSKITVELRNLLVCKKNPPSGKLTPKFSPTPSRKIIHVENTPAGNSPD
jgi:hypothetical protein